MSDLKFTEEHEWLSIDGDLVTMGITDFAQEQLGDIVFVELPNEGDELAPGEEVAVIESVKAAGEINSPISGVVLEINEALSDAPETVNQDPLGAGWFLKARVSGEIDVSDLMDEEAYQAFVADQD